jgi:hypothetical protein
MTDIQLFAFVILPLLILALGWGAVFLNARFGDRGDRERRDVR